MRTMLINPPRKRRRGKRRKMTKAAKRLRRLRGARKARRTRSRRATAGAVKTAVGNLLCGPMKRIRSLRRRCPVKPGKVGKKSRGGWLRRTGRRIHSGIAGILSSGQAPYAKVSNPVKSLRQLPRAALGVVPVVGGMMAGGALLGMAARRVPMLASPLAATGAGLIGAGLLGMVARSVAPKYASSVALGASAAALTNLLRLVPMGAAPTAGMIDYLTERQVAAARPLEGMETFEEDFS